MITYRHPHLIDRWRHQIGERPPEETPRPLGALGYLTRGRTFDGLIEIERVVLVVLHDEPHRGGGKALRLAGYSGRRVPWGAHWGGRRCSKFFKDFALQPVPAARGRRVNADDSRLMNLGLRLDSEITRCLDDRWRAVRRFPVLPRLWAAFRPIDALSVYPDGPEFDTLWRAKNQTPEALLDSTRRQIGNLTLLPLEWTSHCWSRIARLFVDITHLPKCQVFSLRNLPDTLQGYQGAMEYDLFSSRFRDSSPTRGRRQTRHSSVRRNPAPRRTRVGV